MKIIQTIDILSITPNTIELDTRAQRFDKALKLAGYTTLVIEKYTANTALPTSNVEKFSLLSKLKLINLKIIQLMWNKFKNSPLWINSILSPLVLVLYFSYILYINLRVPKNIKAGVVIIHESMYLPYVIYSKIKYKSKILVDVHDDYGQIINGNNRTHFHKYYKQKMEEIFRKILYGIAHKRTTVSVSLSEKLEKEYRVPFLVVRNIVDFFEVNQKLVKKNLTYQENNLSGNIIRGIFIGNFKLSLEFIFLKQLSLVDSQYRLIFDFYGKGYEKVDTKLHNCEYVNFYPPLDLYNSDFDFNHYSFGFVPLNINDPSVLHALPNGIFTLIFAQLPVLYPKLQELDALAKDIKFGLQTDFTDCSNVINNAVKVVEKKDLFSEPIRSFQQSFNWSEERNILLNAIHDMFDPHF